MNNLIFVLSLLQVKHLAFDFYFQPPWMWMNKGTLGHPGGLAHSALHALATFGILIFFATPIKAMVLACVEFFAHYLIDWAKMNINAKKGWKCNEHEQFWWLLGEDQYLHQMTYVCILWMVFA